jgi:MFS family permease
MPPIRLIAVLYVSAFVFGFNVGIQGIVNTIAKRGIFSDECVGDAPTASPIGGNLTGSPLTLPPAESKFSSLPVYLILGGGGESSDVTPTLMPTAGPQSSSGGSMVLPCLAQEKKIAAIINAMLSVTNLVSLPNGFLMDWIGPDRVCIAAMVAWVLATLVSGVDPGPGMVWAIGLIIIGWANSAAFMTFTNYHLRVACDNDKGRFSFWTTVSMACRASGALISIPMSYFLAIEALELWSLYVIWAVVVGVPVTIVFIVLYMRDLKEKKEKEEAEAKAEAEEAAAEAAEAAAEQAQLQAAEDKVAPTAVLTIDNEEPQPLPNGANKVSSNVTNRSTTPIVTRISSGRSLRSNSRRTNDTPPPRISSLIIGDAVTTPRYEPQERERGTDDRSSQRGPDRSNSRRTIPSGFLNDDEESKPSRSRSVSPPQPQGVPQLHSIQEAPEDQHNDQVAPAGLARKEDPAAAVAVVNVLPPAPPSQTEKAEKPPEVKKIVKAWREFRAVCWTYPFWALTLRLTVLITFGSIVIANVGAIARYHGADPAAVADIRMHFTFVLGGLGLTNPIPGFLIKKVGTHIGIAIVAGISIGFTVIWLCGTISLKGQYSWFMEVGFASFAMWRYWGYSVCALYVPTIFPERQAGFGLIFGASGGVAGALSVTLGGYVTHIMQDHPEAVVPVVMIVSGCLAVISDITTIVSMVKLWRKEKKDKEEKDSPKESKAGEQQPLLQGGKATKS